MTWTRFSARTGLLTKGNTLVILTNSQDFSRNPCKGADGCDVALDSESKGGASIVYQAAGKKPEVYGDSTAVTEAYKSSKGNKPEDLHPSKSYGTLPSEGEEPSFGLRLGSKMLGGLGVVGDLYMIYQYGIKENPFRPGWTPPPCDPGASVHLSSCSPPTI
jgi:hypothetical protein